MIYTEILRILGGSSQEGPLFSVLRRSQRLLQNLDIVQRKDEDSVTLGKAQQQVDKDAKLKDFVLVQSS